VTGDMRLINRGCSAMGAIIAYYDSRLRGDKCATRLANHLNFAVEFVSQRL
jgi:hypothetical protein